jgi:DinB superfamily
VQDKKVAQVSTRTVAQVSTRTMAQVSTHQVAQVKPKKWCCPPPQFGGTMPHMTPPTSAEHNPYFSRYISLVPNGNILEMLQTQLEPMLHNLRQLSSEQLEQRYAPDKWNTLEVLRHLIDTERVFTFRATHIARRDPNPLPSFDQDLWQKNAPSSQLSELLEEWQMVRASAVALFSSLSDADWTHLGRASDSPLSPNACAYNIVGHPMYHQKLWLERYGLKI